MKLNENDTDNILFSYSDDSLGVVKTYSEMINVSFERIDRELKKGTFMLFVKKHYFLDSIDVGKWIASELTQKVFENFNDATS